MPRGRRKSVQPPEGLDQSQGLPEGSVANLAALGAPQEAAAQGDAKALQERIAALEAQLAEANANRTETERLALAQAESQGLLMQSQIVEVPTGKVAKVKKLLQYKVVGHKDDGRDILRPVFADEEVPTFFYKIDLPPSGGVSVGINGQQFYHGRTYEFDLHTLRSVKDIIARSWAHENSIRGSNENAYRRPHERRLSGAGMRA